MCRTCLITLGLIPLLRNWNFISPQASHQTSRLQPGLKFDFNSIIKHDNKPIWLDPRQSCLAQPAFPVIRFRSPGAGSLGSLLSQLAACRSSIQTCPACGATKMKKLLFMSMNSEMWHRVTRGVDAWSICIHCFGLGMWDAQLLDVDSQWNGWSSGGGEAWNPGSLALVPLLSESIKRHWSCTFSGHVCLMFS